MDVLVLLLLIGVAIAVVRGVRAEMKEKQRSWITFIGITCILVNIPFTFFVMSFETTEEPTRFFGILQDVVIGLFFCGGILGGAGLLIDRGKSQKKPSGNNEPANKENAER